MLPSRRTTQLAHHFCHATFAKFSCAYRASHELMIFRRSLAQRGTGSNSAYYLSAEDSARAAVGDADADQQGDDRPLIVDGHRPS